MFAIYKRELKSYFRSFIGFLFIAVTLFFIGLYFCVYNLLSGYPMFSYAVSSVAFLFLVSVPILTMRVLAEEKRSRTDQLILTAPVSVGSIVVGKFLALLTIFLIPVVIISFYPLIMTQFGTVPMAEAYLAILAYFLFGMAAIAIGVLISSVTESQVIAAVLGFAVLFLGYMMAGICSILSSTGNLLTKILGCFDLFTHFDEMLAGTLNLEGIVYYLSLTAFALFLTVQSIQKRRYSVSVKRFSAGAYSTVTIAVTLAIVVVFNIIMGEMPVSWKTIDITGNKLYSLTDQSKEYVETIQEDVTIYVLAEEESMDLTLRQTLQRYTDLSDHITVEYVDPMVNPMFYTQYTDEAISGGSVIVVSDKRSKVIDYYDLYESAFDYTTYTSSTTGYDGEGQITSALDYVLTDDMPKVYITEGHNEYPLSTTFLSGLSKQNVEYETINLMKYDAVPEDAACLLINAAGSDFSSDDRDKVIAYLENGGNVVMVTRYSTDAETPNLDEILAFMGLQVTDGLLVEQDANYYYRSPYYLLPETVSTVYTTDVHGYYYIFAPFAQGIAATGEESDELTYTSFLYTSDSAFSKLGVDSMESVEKAEGDIDGPFDIGVEAVLSLGGGDATMVVFGCEQLFTDEASMMVSGANLTMFTNTISSFVGRESNIYVPVKSFEMSLLTVPQTSVFVLAPLVTVVIPVGFLAAGFVVWFRRRRR